MRVVRKFNAKHILRRIFYVNRDPSLLPMNVRSFIASCSVCIALILLYSHANFWNKSAACGLVTGIFGSGILYWETIADEYGLRSISNELARSNNKRLSFFETGMVITFVQIGIVQFFLFVPPWFTSLKIGQNGFWTLGGVSLTFAVFISPAIGTYLFVKLLRYRSYIWLQGFQAASDASQREMTKRFLRTFGFASLFLSGIMQVPAALV